MESFKKPLLYVASRASLPERSAMWRALRNDGWKITSTWIDEAGPGETRDYIGLWHRIETEISRSDGLILYAERDDFPLKGALIEAGIAIGLKKPVAIVLPGPPFLEPRTLRPIGSWVYHMRCEIFNDLADARNWISSQLI